jgi:murein DD-endopeptidase MepM/ murein hydrolase activator NlpD
MNEEQVLGNHVIIDHGNQEFSFLCHLQNGSVTVKPGQTLAAGDALGRCGNSGRSSEPHLHYHMQNKPEPFRGEGLPAQFSNYRAGDTVVPRGEPKRGETVSAGAAGGKATAPKAAGTKKRPPEKGGSSASRTGEAR